jgi:1,4-alpha-glucan branching enzyme
VVYENFRIGVAKQGKYTEVFNTDSPEYGGSGQANPDVLTAETTPWHNQPCSISIKVPPLAMIVLKKKKLERKGKA